MNAWGKTKRTLNYVPGKILRQNGMKTVFSGRITNGNNPKRESFYPFPVKVLFRNNHLIISDQAI